MITCAVIPLSHSYPTPPCRPTRHCLTLTHSAFTLDPTIPPPPPQTNLPDDLQIKTVLEQKYRMMVGQHTDRPLANLRQSFVDQKGTAARKAGTKPRALDPISSLQDEVKRSIESDPKIRLAQSRSSANLDSVLGTAIAPQDSSAMTEASQLAAAAGSGEVGGPARSSAALHHPTHLESSPSFGPGAHAAQHRRAHKPLVVL